MKAEGSPGGLGVQLAVPVRASILVGGGRVCAAKY